jgi:CDP-diacylglycerol--glycerol-3-phosphate 3-phosphatidyltransferase
MANLITLSRIPILIGIVLILYLGGPWLKLAAVPIIVILILLDTLDGIVARRRHETGLVGSKLDIAVDRAVELVMWVVYTDLALISVAIPIIFIIRGTLVDTVRSFGVMLGKTPFGMMQTAWGQRLVASSIMRTTYGVAKAAAFSLLALTLGLQELWQNTPRAEIADSVWLAAVLVSWIATALCLVRGLPVLFEARALLGNVETQTLRPPVTESTPPTLIKRQ